jgi:hypothetical protein
LQGRIVATGDRWPATPYKGLNFYTAADAPLFGEREAEVEGCAELIGQFTTRLLLLHGRSGTGKSSFLRAGLIPRLESERPGFHVLRKDKGEHADPTLIRCTDDPLSRIHHVLTMALDADPLLNRLDAACRGKAEAALGAGIDRDRMEVAGAVIEALTALTAGLSQTFVLVIDQSEEVLTLQTRRDQRNRRRAFFHLIEELCLRNLDLRMIVALRTEYYGQFCDSFRINPTLTVTATATARAGLEQFMLHGLGDEDRIAAAIRRPTLTEAIEPYGVPRDRYGFSYAPDVPEQIAHDLLEHCGESSTLPVLQIVCNDLYSQVVVKAGRDVITMDDYKALGRVQGQVDAYIDHTIRDVLEETGAEAAGEADVIRWRKLLSTLVGRQEGGAVTTMIRTEGQLVDVAGEQGIQGNVRQLLDKFADEKWRLLRSMTIVAEGPESERRGYSLGHDAIAVALFQWSEAHEKLERERRAVEKRARKERMRAERQTRNLRYGAALFVLFALMTASLAMVQAYDDRKDMVARLNKFAESDTSSDFRLHLLLLLSSLSYSEGIWGTLRLLPAEKTRAELRRVILQSPRHGGQYAAAGVDDEGRRMALLGTRGEVTLQDLHSGAVTPLSPLSDTTLLDGMPRRAAAGFMPGADRPIFYRGGVLTYGDGPKSTDVSLEQFVGDKASSIPSLAWAQVEIGGGAIRIPFWSTSRQEGTSLKVLVLQRQPDGAVVPVMQPPFSLTPPDATARTLPAFSADSKYFARIERPSRGNDFDIFVARLADPTRGGRIAVTAKDHGGGIEPEINEPRPLVFSENSQAVIVRDSRQTLRVFSFDERDESRIVLNEELEVEIPRGARDFSRSAWSQRAPLAAVKLQPHWRFAWLDSNNRVVVKDSHNAAEAGPAAPLLGGTNGARRLDFSRDGRFLALQQFAGGQQFSGGMLQVRVWDLAKERGREVEAMDTPALRREACRIAALDPRGSSLSEAEKITWTGAHAPQPCGGK